MKQGIVYVPINILYREREVAHILADAEPKAVIARGEFPGGTAVWQVDELGDAEPLPPDPSLTGDSPGGAGLHVGHDRDIQRRDPDAQ